MEMQHKILSQTSIKIVPLFQHDQRQTKNTRPAHCHLSYGKGYKGYKGFCFCLHHPSENTGCYATGLCHPQLFHSFLSPDSSSPAIRTCISTNSKVIPCQIQGSKQNTSLLAKCLHTNLYNYLRPWRGSCSHIIALTLNIEIQLNQMHQTQLAGWLMSNLHRWWLKDMTSIQRCLE